MRGRKLALIVALKASKKDKKRIPEWGDGNTTTSMPLAVSSYTIKKESPNEGTETASSGERSGSENLS